MADRRSWRSEVPDEATEVVRAVHGYWDGLRRGRRFPARSDMDPLDVPDLLPWIMLIDVREGEPRFVYRLVGTGIVGILRQDPTGAPVGTGAKPYEIPNIRARYDAVAATGRCIFHAALLQEDRDDYTEVQRMLMPLGNSEDRVDKVLGVLARAKERP